MEMSILDVLLFIAFIVIVISLAMYKSRKGKDSTDYFLAGRSVTWPLVGFSLIASNISTEQFVGMSGQGAGNSGLAVASYEWMAAITIVLVAMFFLPRFLRAGIFTIPEYLEYRYNKVARRIMSCFLMVVYVFVTIVAVIYSGGITLHTLWPKMSIVQAVWLVGIAAAIYTTKGGLTAVIWADLVQGATLILGGCVVMFLSFNQIGGWTPFMEQCGSKMHMVMPADHPEIPWTVLLMGLWIPNFYYWGLNQYITQRTLAAKSLREGQLGCIFAAGMKLLVPFFIVLPGIMAPVIFKDRLGGSATAMDAAYPMLIKELVPIGLRGFVLAALAGAVMGALAAMLNSASTIFTMDIYKNWIDKTASQKKMVVLGKIATVIFVVIGCLIAPQLANPNFGGVFKYIQEFQGYISPGILMAFVFGFLFKKAPAAAGIGAMIGCPIIYGILAFLNSHIKTNVVQIDTFLNSFLNRMAVTFVVLFLVMLIITIAKPLKEPRVMPVNEGFDMKPSRSVKTLGYAVIVMTIALYIIFW